MSDSVDKAYIKYIEELHAFASDIIVDLGGLRNEVERDGIKGMSREYQNLDISIGNLTRNFSKLQEIHRLVLKTDLLMNDKEMYDKLYGSL